MPDEPELLDLLLDRAAASSLSEAAKELLLAAVVGEDALDATGGGSAPPKREAARPAIAHESPPIYLSGIEATGFRGIAACARPGPQPVPVPTFF